MKTNGTNRRRWIGGGIILIVLIGLFISPLGEVVLLLVMNRIATTTFTVRGEELIMNGEINAKTYDQFRAIMDKNPQITTLVEEVVPGSQLISV